ncbi:MAG: hypothetical protein ACJ75H_10825 [Thermoanaerobaculia bacterium]
MEIDIREAVRLAKDFATAIYAGEKISRLGLEAIERTDDAKFWLVTLGFSRPWTGRSSRPAKTPLDRILRPEAKLDRDYKIFRVDVRTGNVVSMGMLVKKGTEAPF